jgi:hypothetical protein
MLKEWNDGDDVDDTVRTTVQSQNHATATLSSEESFFRTLYLDFSPHIRAEVWGGGQEIDCQHNTYDSASWVLSSQPGLRTAKQDFIIL